MHSRFTSAKATHTIAVHDACAYRFPLRDLIAPLYLHVFGDQSDARAKCRLRSIQQRSEEEKKKEKKRRKRVVDLFLSAHLYHSCELTR
jgi:hypothetical protein